MSTLAKQVTAEDCEALWGGPEKFKAWEETWKQWLIDLPYDWDPKEALEAAKKDREKGKDGDGKGGDDKADGTSGKRDGPVETPDPEGPSGE